MMSRRIVAGMLILFLLAFTLSWFGCGGGGSSGSSGPSPNPIPNITTLSPASTTVGAAVQTLTLNGTSFLSTSAVTYNGVAHIATFVNATQLTITLSSSDVATAGSFAVVVTNPTPGGGASNSVNFAVNNPVPSVNSLSPTSSTAGAPAQTLTINGAGFLSTSTVTYNSVGHTATYVSASQLNIQLSAGDQATGGTYPVVVTNPAPGGGTSNSLNFAVNDPVPSLTSLSPAVLAVGSSDTTITVNGSNFVGNSQVAIGNTALATTYVSATQLTASIPANTLASAGALQVAVDNPSPGGGTSGAVPLTVVAVASFAVLAVTQNSGMPNGPWTVAAAAVDPSGNPIVGLPVNLSTDAGTLVSSAGATDSVGAFSTTLKPPSASTAVAVVSAVTGAQTATAVISFSSASNASAARSLTSHRIPTGVRRKASSSARANAAQTTTFYSYPLALGGAGSPGSTNVFANSTDQSCYSNAVLSGEETTPTDCALVLSQDHARISWTNLATEACQADSVISEVTGIGNCAGAVAIPVGCALATVPTGGLDDLVCGGLLTAPELAFATSCAEFLVGLFARSQLVDQVLNLSDYEVDIAQCASDPLSCANAALDVVGLYCTASTASPPSTSQPICPAGSACVYVTNATSNTISVFDTAGNPLTVPSGAFPNLSTPDGLAYNNGNLYVTNTGNKTVTIYDLNGNQVFIPNAFSNLSAAGDPEDITFDASSGEFFINDATSNQMYVYDQAGNPVSLASGAFPNLSGPYGVFWNPLNDVIYVSNDGTNTINAYTPSGTPITLSGSFAGLSAPDDFVVDPSNGNIYVTEASTGFLGLCAVSGIAEFDSNGNPVTPSGGFSTVNCPDSIALLGTSGVGAPELLYVTNIFGNSITVYDQNGNDLTTQVAPGGFPGLSEPTGIAIVSLPAASK